MIKLFKSEEINKGLQEQQHLYLSGNLTEYNAIDNFKTQFETVIGNFSTFICEKPHIHNINDEYMYILTGECKVYIFNENKEYHLQQGDLFICPKGIAHVVKGKKGTRVYTTKNPGGNDKEVLDIDILNWSKSFESSF